MLSDVLLPLDFFQSLTGTVCMNLMYFNHPWFNLYGVDSQLQHVEEGLIQLTSVALHGEFSCNYKVFTMLCNSSYSTLLIRGDNHQISHRPTSFPWAETIKNVSTFQFYGNQICDGKKFKFSLKKDNKTKPNKIMAVK